MFLKDGNVPDPCNFYIDFLALFCPDRLAMTLNRIEEESCLSAQAYFRFNLVPRARARFRPAVATRPRALG